MRTTAATAAALALASVLWHGEARAQALPTYPLTNTPGTLTAWGPDRYRPARFNNAGTQLGRANVLQLGLDAADGPGNRPPEFAAGFYDTQGRELQRLAWGAPRYSFVASLYVPTAWGASSGLLDTRRSDMWGTATPTNVTDPTFAQFAIIGFTNEGVPDLATLQPGRAPLAPPDVQPEGGGSGRYQVFDGEAGGFQPLATPVRYDQWSDFCISLTPTALEYRLGDILVYTDSTISVDVGGTPTPVTGFIEVIMQAKNFGQRPTPPGGVAGTTYDAQWSALAFGAGTCDEVRITGGLAADLQISKSASPAVVALGGTTVFTLGVQNNGPAPATGAVVTDTLPAGLTYLSNTCGAVYAAPTLTWTIGNLAAGQAASCSVSVRLTTAGTYVNTATVDADQTDPVAANNSASTSVSGTLVAQLPALGGWSWLWFCGGICALALWSLRRGD